MPFRRRSGDLEKLYRQYKDQAEFFLIYIREAHPGSIVHMVKEGKKGLQKIGQTNDEKERKRRVEEMKAELKMTIPALVDRADNKVNSAYAAWPERLYVIDTAGKVTYRGGQGPRNFRPEEVGAWLKKNAK